MKTILPIFLLATCGLSFYGGQPSENLDKYSNSCSFVVGEEAVNYIWYNDADGDCRTRDWYLEIVLRDGRIYVARSSDENRPLEWDLSDKHSCCLLCMRNEKE